MPSPPSPGRDDFGASHLLRPINMDENSLLDATQRLQVCQRDMQVLIAGSPTVRDAINHMLEEHLQLDGERTGVEFTATDQRGTSRISMTEACLYVQQHPFLNTQQMPEGKAVSLPKNHRLLGYTLPMLLDELKTLDLEQALKDSWTRYWRSTRAPQQPMSCHARAAELYKIHFEASGQLQQAMGLLSSEALQPLFATLDPLPSDSDDETVCAEQILLKCADTNALALPGGWVLTQNTDHPVSQLLYMPAQQPAWRTFTKRTDMERWLIDQRHLLFSSPQNDPQATIEYRVKTNPLDTGITLWLNQLADAQYQAALNAIPLLTIDDANLARLQVDQFDALRRNQSPFAMAPEPPAARPTDTAPLKQFGLLYPGLPYSLRQAKVQQQRDALDTLLAADDPTTTRETRLQTLRQQLEALRTQQDACATAAHHLLHRRRLDISALNTHFTALYLARVAGLRIEAHLQHLLNQITSDELKMLEIILDAPVSEDRQVDVAVCSLKISVTEQTNATKKIIETELKGPLVIVASQALEWPSTSTASHLLYWPGRGGALQHFSSRQALEQALFEIEPDDSEWALQLTELSVNAFEYSLSTQQVHFDEQVAHLHSTWSAPANAGRLAREVATLRETTLDTLLVPDHSAREIAFLEIVEQNNSSHLAETMPVRLLSLDDGLREALKNQLKQFVPAFRRSQALLDRLLPARDTFVRQQIDARLRKDFSITQGYSVQLDLPDSVRKERHPVSGGSGVGGTPVRMVHTPSSQRGKLSLDELALRNIDDTLSTRLRFMVVEASADDANELDKLKAGITHTYLTRLVKELNLAKAYETRIYEAHKGTARESLFQRDYRRECLCEPWRLMLKLQGEMALLQHHINHDELHTLNTAIDANSRETWDTGTKRITLLPAVLTVGGEGAKTDGPVTLSGITFIQEKNSGVTLLYLPDSPDQRYLRRYDSLEQARKRLFELCSQDTMVQYIAERAITGDVRTHINRIDQATAKHYDAMIGVGFAWPPTTSLAEHLLNAQMGRLIEANRNDTRSNEDLAQELYALKSGYLFNGIKIAISFIPLIGTAMSLVDAGINLYGAVDAFRRGNVHSGIEQLASVFECLVYAVMDVATFAALPTARSSTARNLTRRHQLKHPWRQRLWRNLKLRQEKNAERHFAGYEFNEWLDIGSLQPVQAGAYRQTWRNSSGEHFIFSEGYYFKVKFDPTTHEMRLVTPGKHYTPAIALDETLEWNTYSALHGGYLTPYGAGSRRRGAQRAANVPSVVEQQLPATRPRAAQRKAMIDEYEALSKELDALNIANERVLERYLHEHGSASNPQALNRKRQAAEALDQLWADEIEKFKTSYIKEEALALLPGESMRQNIASNHTRAAHIISHRMTQRIAHADAKKTDLLKQITEIITRMQNTRPWSAERLALLEEIKQLRMAMVRELDTLAGLINELPTWFQRVTEPARRQKIHAAVTEALDIYTEQTLLAFRSGQLLQALTRRQTPSNIAWIYQEALVQNLRIALDRVLATHLELPKANITRAQRNQILQNIIETYDKAHRNLSAWHLMSPDHFEPACIHPLLDHLTHLMERARRGLRKKHAVEPDSKKMMFETEDGQLLIGSERPAAQQSPRQFIVSNRDGVTIEAWDQISGSNKFRLNTGQSQPITAPPPLPNELAPTVTEARSRLEAVEMFEVKVNSYKTMEPINLEHMLVSEANALESRASQLQKLDITNPLIEQLQSRAARLIADGETLRIQRTLASKTPTEGYLDYLKQKARVEIRKEGLRSKLKEKRPDGQADYLQEYAIHNTATPGAKPLWFAHFHYVAETSAFDTFVKAHLKISEQRYLGMKWQVAQTGTGFSLADVKIWRGNIDKPIANQHFAPAE